MDDKTLEDFLVNFKSQDRGYVASEALKRQDLNDLLTVILTLLTYVNLGQEDLGSVKEYLEDKTKEAKRLRKLIIDLEEFSTTSTGGYYYPFVWTREEEVAFLDMMHYVLFKVGLVNDQNKRALNSAFEGIHARWHANITDPDLVG